MHRLSTSPLRLSSLPLALSLYLTACAHLPAPPLLRGVVAVDGGPLARAHVSVRDSQGTQRAVQADADGHYTLDATGLVAPLAIAATRERHGNCRYNHIPRSTCLTALLPTLAAGDNRAHINPLTDWVVSEVATALHFTGPQQLAEAAHIPAIPAPVYAQALVQLRAGFGAALAHAGVADTGHFDPVTSDMQADGKGVNAVLAVLNHTRGYDNASGEASGAILTDTAWRPIAPPFGPRANEALDLPRAERERSAIQAARVRIFIVGDSTAATYERQRLPRMGWGQVFETEFQDGAGVKVVNGARAGRSSRDFFNGGWYRQMLRYLQPGDYVVIAHGHNDQNCNAARALRGAADVANLCTYPNDARGQRQFPPGQPHLSFQTSLEVYVHDARARGAIPVLMTPTTRFLNSERKVAYTAGDLRPVVSQHVTRQNGAAGYAFTGDYSQTVRDTAHANGVPLIDLEAKTIRFANVHAHDWKDYWLVVSDTVKFPWYATQTAGTPAAPDTTHFQENGARAVAALVAQGIKETPPLRALAQHLR